MWNPGGRGGAVVVWVAMVAALALTVGCATAAKKMEMKWSVGAGAGMCNYDPKDRSLFQGSVDDGDPCYRVLARVHGNQEPPQRIIPEKGSPVVTVPNGPFAEVGYSDLGETGFNGLWLGTGTPTSDVGTVQANAWHLGVGWSYPLHRRVGIFGRVGYAFWDVDEDELFGGAPESHSASGEDALLGGGFNFGISEKLLLELQWSRYMNVGSAGETGEGDVDASTLTLLYRF